MTDLQLLSKIGGGSSGIVFKCRCNEKPYACKVVSVKSKSLKREIKALMRVREAAKEEYLIRASRNHVVMMSRWVET